ncbi:hypothetical protein [Kosmotoga pacifica]|uniref:HD domain-containing protein n=1 Tax=Kosmotoga pacifica TaxID=1330330 RepID=A0A0G2Z7S3_9BACT|nr:hypothetical protein [Kosmotoga pacifica]AKI97650.1 hypothetical protein IX53_07290 [Kosmotoga pacifica]
MVNIADLYQFVRPYYENKDIMHDLSHIDRVLKTANKLGKRYEDEIDHEVLMIAAYFHGFIYKDEKRIREWLKAKGLSDDKINKIVQVAWESQKKEIPRTLEGKILHDAHMIEGGKTFLIVKSLITGSVRGQSLDETIEYMEKNILGKGQCYLAEAKEIYAEQQKFAREFISDLKEGLK